MSAKNRKVTLYQHTMGTVLCGGQEREREREKKKKKKERCNKAERSAASNTQDQEKQPNQSDLSKGSPSQPHTYRMQHIQRDRVDHVVDHNVKDHRTVGINCAIGTSRHGAVATASKPGQRCIRWLLRKAEKKMASVIGKSDKEDHCTARTVP